LSGAPIWQVPLAQVSTPLQMLWSSHCALAVQQLGTPVWTHMWVALLQESVVQELPSSHSLARLQQPAIGLCTH